MIDIEDNNHMPDDICQAVRSFVKGTITTQQLAELSTWVHASDENRQEAASLAEMLFSHEVDSDKTRYDVESALVRFRLAIDEPVITLGRKRMPKLMIAVSSAAAVLICVLLLASYWFGKTSVKNQFAEIVVEAPAGSQLTAVLPDGSSVDLNADSRLTYSQGFGINDRTVKLEGEGMFHVKHQDKKPFTVKTEGMVITDIGTTFKAYDYKGEKTATVDLIEGSVDVSNVLPNGTHCEMQPGQRVNVNKLTGEVSRYRNEANILSTNINSINFIDTPMDDIACQLSRIYGVEVKVSAEASDIKFYGFFNRREQSLQTILKALASTGLVKYTYKNGKYTIYKAYAN